MLGAHHLHPLVDHRDQFVSTLLERPFQFVAATEARLGVGRNASFRFRGHGPVLSPRQI
jgi:hypothetical protein